MSTERLLSEVRRSITSLDLSSRTFVVGVSGGADSCTLLHALALLKEELGCTLVVAHGNHQLRGTESAGDEEFVRRLASTYGLRTVVEQLPLTDAAHSEEFGIESAARELRYAFFRGAAVAVGAGAVFTGHTLEDNAETVLMHLSRGSGTKGLRGITRTRELHPGVLLHRPLLSIRRSIVRDAALQWGLRWREDSSNASSDFTRNRVRNTLFPVLIEVFGPSIAEQITHSAAILGRVHTAIENSTNRIAAYAVQQEEHCTVFNADVLLEQPAAIAEEMFRLAGNMRSTDLTRLQSLLTAEVGSSASLSNKRMAFRDRTGIVIQHSHTEEIAPELVIPGTGQYVADSQTLDVRYTNEIGATFPGVAWQVVIDATSVRGELRWRRWQDGDRFQPFGMQGTVLVSDLLTNARVAFQERKSVRVVCDNEGILWVCGLRQAERTRVTATSHSFLILTHRS